MKKIKTLITLIFIFFYTNNYAQYASPPDIVFNNDINPNWSYTVKDDNFIKAPIDKWSSPYWAMRPIDIKLVDNDLIILNATYSQSPIGGEVGCILQSIDNTTGNLNWRYHNNTYSGNVHRENYDSSSGIKVLSNGDIEICGIKQIDSISAQEIYFQGNPIIRTIDGSDGSLKSQLTGIDTSKQFIKWSSLSNQLLSLKDEYIYVGWKNYLEDGFLKENVGFYALDDQFDIINPALDSFENNTNIVNGFSNFSLTPKISKLNENTVALLFGANVPDSLEISPIELSLHYIDVSDLDNIHEIKSVDVREDEYFPQSIYSTETIMLYKDENITLQQSINVEYEDKDDERFIWMTWYDIEGNKKAKIDTFHLGGRYYTRMRPIGVIGENMYIMGTYRDDFSEGVDIVKVIPGDNNYEKIGNLSILPTDTTDIGIYNADILPNGELVVQTITKLLVEGYVTNFTTYYNFDLEQLGLPSSISSVPTNEKAYSLYPNPTSDQLIIKLDDNPQQVTIHIYDITGKSVYKQTHTGSNEIEIPTSNLIPTIYNISIVVDNKYELERKKFVKL